MVATLKRPRVLINDEEYIADIESHTETITIPMIDAVEPDPNWVETDFSGHTHRAVLQGDRVLYPTLVLIPSFVEETYWCRDCEEHHDEYSSPYYVCRFCGAKMNPARIRSSATKYIAGPTSIELTVWGSYIRPGTDVEIQLGDCTMQGRVSKSETQDLYAELSTWETHLYLTEEPDMDALRNAIMEQINA